MISKGRGRVPTASALGTAYRDLVLRRRCEPFFSSSSSLAS
jgi:hypothetical protein